MIKSSLALGTLVSLISAPALATTDVTKPKPLQFFTPQELINAGALPQLVHTVATTRVPVVKGTADFAICNRPGFVMRAAYNPTINAIVICLNNAKPGTIATSFTHEAVHLVQDCKAGLQNEYLETTGPLAVRNVWDNLLTKEKRENIKHSYAPSDWDVETEAFFLQDHPKIVAKAVAQFCF